MIGECGFHYAGPLAWNSLIATLHELPNPKTVPMGPRYIVLVLFIFYLLAGRHFSVNKHSVNYEQLKRR